MIWTCFEYLWNRDINVVHLGGNRMIEAILQLFTSEQKAQAILSNQMIELIFIILFVTFIVTFFVHVSLFSKLKKIRSYLQETNRMDINPLRTFKEQFDLKQQTEPVKIETFVQEKFSSWRVYGIPIVSLIKMIQMTVSIFILIGILGTFIGLTMSLGNINSGGNQLVEDVASVLSGIDVAFYTSIAGMGLSLIMTVMIKALNTEFLLTDIMLKVETNLTENEQNGISKLIEVSESINNSILMLQKTNQKSLQSIESSFDGFKDYTSGLQQAAKDLATFNEGLSTNLHDFQLLFTSMNKVTNGFDDASKKLNKNFDQLFSYFKKIDQRNEQMASTFEHTYQKIEEVSTTQIDTLTHFEDTVVDLKTFTSSILDGQQTISKESQRLVRHMEEQNKEFKQIFGKDLGAKLAGITTYLSELSNGFNSLEGSLVQLPDVLETINQAQTEYKHLLSDRFDELKQFNRDFNNHLKAHNADSVSFEKHVREATNTYEQIGMKNKQLITDINTTISQMNSTFIQRENQLEANVGVLKDTLANYVTTLEGTLGEKLDKVARNISEYAQGTNQDLKREFKEIRTINEDIQQSNNRYTQQTFTELLQQIDKLNQHLQTFSQEATSLNTRRTGGLNQHD